MICHAFHGLAKYEIDSERNLESACLDSYGVNSVPKLFGEWNDVRSIYKVCNVYIVCTVHTVNIVCHVRTMSNVYGSYIEYTIHTVYTVYIQCVYIVYIVNIEHCVYTAHILDGVYDAHSLYNVNIIQTAHTVDIVRKAHNDYSVNGATLYTMYRWYTMSSICVMYWTLFVQCSQCGMCIRLIMLHSAL